MSMTRIETSPVSAISGSSIQLADDYLDFSMPSYGDTVSNSAKAKASDSAPAFSNPFSDFGSTSSDTAAEDKAASKAAKEQAAADKKAADEEAAARKKAEKEARREAEKEKQRLAVERANQIKEEKAAAAAEAAPAASYELPEIKAPEFKAPDIKVPEFKAPDIKVPEFKAPDFGGFKAPETSVDVPEFKAPEFKAPDFKAPDIKMPDVSLPKFSMPKMPDMPKIDTPSVSTPSFSAPSTSFEAPKVPSFSAPSVPSFSAPSVPSFSAPSFSSSSDGYSSLDADIVDDQEERDTAAKEARSVFNEADANAKVSYHTTSNSNVSLNYEKTFLVVLVTVAFHSHTTYPHFFSHAFTISRCHHRKWRTRQGNCELLLMIRRRLRRKPRMQPVRHDSAVNSFAFDHSELDTKLTLFTLFALRNCDICYSSAKRMQNRTSSFWMFIPTNVWEKDFLTLHTAGTIMLFEAYYLIILLKITLCIVVSSKVRSNFLLAGRRK